MQKQQDDQSYIKGTKSMQKMQEIADRLASTTPELTKYVNPDAILKPSKMISESVPVGKKGESTEAKLKKKQIQQTVLMNKNEMSAQDWINKCQELQLLLDKEQDKTKQLEIELSNRQERFVHRELEYRKTIEELQMELRLKTALDQGDRKVMDQIYKDHNKIIEGINNIQLRTSKILVDQERDIIRFFNNKINEIKKQFEEERIKKGKNDQEYIEKENQLISELEWIKNIAQKIDNENHSLMQKYKELKIQYQTQENDREMLLKELIMKKKKNAILKAQIQQYEKLRNELEKDEEEENISESQQDFNNRSQPKVRIRSVKKNLQQSQVKTIRSNDEYISKNESQVDGQSSLQFTVQRYEKTIKMLQSTLGKEKKRVRELKQLYIREMDSKSELELVLRKCVEDIKQEIIQIKGEARIFNQRKNKNGIDEMDKEDRDRLIERLLNNEKIITLLHDKIFYPDKKQVDVPIETQNEEYEHLEDQF